jgi:hypothetical protein
VAKRTVELPGDGEEFITAQQAGKHLGVSAATFRRLLAQPQFAWVQEKRMGKQVVRYSAKDVWAMGHLIDRGAALPDLAGPDAQDDD